jgi:hypothetical protein
MIDIERIVDDITSFLQANVNTKITEINTEKNDGITLSQIDNAAYFLQTLNYAVTNYNPFLHIAVIAVDTVPIGPATIANYRILVSVILENDTEDLAQGKKLFRYARVLKELFEKNFASILPAITFKVSSLAPGAFESPREELFLFAAVELNVGIG